MPQHVWVAGPGTAHPGELLAGDAATREMINAAIIVARTCQHQRIAEQDDAREATWRERALNAEQALKPPMPNSSAKSATWKPNGLKKPSSASGP
ncbi:hypothetical protein [Actinoplanes derwentensis]|uniref:hypothetical protein n=1 Tax=Actinoplanes derwentensis TaxID=113562 RepID=UPI000B2D3A80|nr:hypothetical protein [Actinoplanes derwentensis]GID87476.1 hypothetical protein Ade03nite_64000 [Actinoplanes derwentensis]